MYLHLPVFIRYYIVKVVINANPLQLKNQLPMPLILQTCKVQAFQCWLPHILLRSGVKCITLKTTNFQWQKPYLSLEVHPEVGTYIIGGEVTFKYFF